MCTHYAGYKGKDCSTKSSSSGDDLNYSPALLGLIITLFVIIALLVGGIFLMIRQLAAYKEDMTNYPVTVFDSLVSLLCTDILS